jgi:hypothetical protein
MILEKFEKGFCFNLFLKRWIRACFDIQKWIPRKFCIPQRSVPGVLNKFGKKGR